MIETLMQVVAFGAGHYLLNTSLYFNLAYKMYVLLKFFVYLFTIRILCLPLTVMKNILFGLNVDYK